MFTLAISCLTTSNLCCFMDLTFQVPRPYCSLHDQIFLPSPVTSPTGFFFFFFCFVSISLFFLELFLHWFPVADWTPTNLGSSSFSVLFFPFHTIHGILKARVLKLFVIAFSSGPRFVRTFHHDPSVWVALHGMAHSFLELDKVVVHVIRLISFLWLWFSVCLPSDGREGNGTPLQYSCLENPMDRGAW